MKNIIIKISIIIVIILILLTNISFAKYKYSFEFDAMELSYIKPQEPPFTNILFVPQTYTFNLSIMGLDTTKVGRIETTFYFAEHPDDVVVKNVRVTSTNTLISLNNFDFVGNYNKGTLEYRVKIMDKQGLVIFDQNYERIIT